MIAVLLTRCRALVARAGAAVDIVADRWAGGVPSQVHLRIRVSRGLRARRRERRRHGAGLIRRRAVAGGIRRPDYVIVRRAAAGRGVAIRGGGDRRAAVHRSCALATHAGAAIDVVAAHRAAGGRPTQVDLGGRDRRGAQARGGGRDCQGVVLIGGRTAARGIYGLDGIVVGRVAIARCVAVRGGGYRRGVERGSAVVFPHRCWCCGRCCSC